MNVKTLLGSLRMAATAISPALAQTCSVKPISLIVPYPAGGPSDFFARKVQPEATAKLGKTVVVENLGGAICHHHPTVLAVRNSLNVKTVDELLALARKNAGKPLSYGSVGPGSLYHLIGEKFSQLTQVEMLHVP